MKINTSRFSYSFFNYILILISLSALSLFQSCKEDEPGPRPKITGFSPTSGSVGTVVNITGNNFSSTKTKNIVKFNGIPATVTSATSSSLIVTVPAGATTGKITVTVNQNTATSAEDFSVLSPPAILAFSPSIGAVGSVVTISGTGFSASPGDNIVTFNGISASVTAATTTTLTVTVPVGATTGKIKVTVNSNTVTSTTNYNVILEVIKAGGNDFDQGNSIVVDHLGNTYVAGSFRGTANFGSNSIISDGSDDIFLAKYNSSCDVLWVKRVGSSSSDIARSIAVDGDGNIFMTGEFAGVVSFGSTTLSSAGGSIDIFIAKFNSSGTIEWAKQTGSGAANAESGDAITSDANGNVYVTGTFFQSITIGSTNLTSVGESDVFVAKYNANSGEVVWAKRFGGLDSDSGHSLAVNSSGDIYVSGSFFGTTIFGTTSIPSAGGLDAFLTKLNASGDVVWAKSIAGSEWENAFSVAVDANGDCYVSGYFIGTTTFGTIALSSFGNEDIFLAKYTAAGTVAWAIKAGGTDYDQSRSVAVDNAGNPYITGYFARTITMGDQSLTSSNNSRDIFVAKFNTTGTLQWVKQAGGTNDDYGCDIATDSEGTVYTAGNFRETVTFGTTTLTSSGSDDIYLWKIRQ